MNLNFTTFPILHTNHLELRPLKMSDAAAMFAMRSHPSAHQYLEKAPPKDLTEIEEKIEQIHQGMAINKWIFWVISLKNQADLIGTIGLWNISIADETADLGYEMSHSFQQKGFMQEALTTVLKYGFEQMNCAAIEAVTHQDNVNSVKLLRRNKFIKKGITAERKTDWPKDNELFSLSKIQFQISTN